MNTTIKLTKETKQRLDELPLVEKNKTYDTLVNELITYYKQNEKAYKKDMVDWRKQWDVYKKDWETYEKNKKEHAKEVEAYNKQKKTWDNLLKWAKKQGFKG